MLPVPRGRPAGPARRPVNRPPGVRRRPPHGIQVRPLAIAEWYVLETQPVTGDPDVGREYREAIQYRHVIGMRKAC
jgi:hypothetical protein